MSTRPLLTATGLYQDHNQQVQNLWDQCQQKDERIAELESGDPLAEVVEHLVEDVAGLIRQNAQLQELVESLEADGRRRRDSP